MQTENEMRAAIQDALSQVIYPNFEKDIVSFGFVTKIELNNNVCYLKITIPSSNEQVIAKIKEDVIIKTRVLNLANIDIEIVTPSVQKTQTAQSAKNIAPTIKHFVMVSSGKGGVGKSTTSVNLAISLAKSGKKVGLLDADIYGPNIPRMLGLSGVEPKTTQDGKKLSPLEQYGIKTISIESIYGRGQSFIWRGPVVMRIIAQLLQDVEWGELDIMVVDMPPGTGDAQLTLAQSVPVGAGINVTTPQMVALDDGFRALDMFKKCNIPIFGIIENMSGFTCPDCNKTYDIFGKGSSQMLADEFKTQVVAKIPIEPSIVSASDEGKPISFYEPDSNTSKIYMQTAARLIDFLQTNKADNSKIQPQ